jgi:ABC-type Fe3+/spermidine/putrescine transport system ATPase subunit
MAVSDVVVLMSAGRVISVDTPRNTYDRPSNLYAASFVGSSNAIMGSVERADRGEATIRLSTGELITGHADQPLAVGSKAAATIKSVDIIVDPGRINGTNVLHGDVVSTTYTGPNVELIVRVIDRDFRVLVDRHAPPSVGDSMTLYLPADRVTVLS